MAILEAFLEDNDRNNMLLQRTIRDIDEGGSAVKAWGRPPSA